MGSGNMALHGSRPGNGSCRGGGRFGGRVGISVVVIVAIFCLLGTGGSGSRTYTMESSSMKPTIDVGDSVRVQLGGKCCRAVRSSFSICVRRGGSGESSQISSALWHCL